MAVIGVAYTTMPQPSTPHTAGHVGRCDTGGLGHRLDAGHLGGMARLLIGGDVPPVVDARGEHAGVVAGAVVRGLELVVAAQVVFAQADVGQHAAHEVDVDRRPDVRCADDGRLRDAPAEVVDRAVVDPRTRLERLGGRAPVRREVGVAVAGDFHAAIVHHAGDKLVPALDRGTAPDVHDDGIVLAGHTSTVVPVSLVSKSSGR
jgi:hypothetical protein